MTKHNPSDVVPVQDFTIAISHPDLDDLDRGSAAARRPPGAAPATGPLANARARTEHWVVWP
ncbi:hypothetical protein FHR32_007814 [Streptosporangium album]|uniref:Uncharacterized protein n=1 Tax=Streptosporangium album TaxID=47479 RepID=A0A7W7S3U1_9ACTN|nr:hypothetical protein [Streptosporangium album]MBB4943414.1 hypothetical protein [Streptosporangium album]